MKTVSINVYSLEELTGNAREKAIQWIREGNYDWSQQVEEDAKKYGVKLESWDIYRKEIQIKVENPVQTAIAIFEDYSEIAEIYQQARSFMDKRNEIEANPSDDHYEQSQRFEENAEIFRNHLGKMFLKNLIVEYDYQNTDEYCLDTAKANNWMFDAQGKFFE